MDLRDFFNENRKAAIAFSGGVDSAYLLYAAVNCGADVCAYYAKSSFQPAFEEQDALRLARSLGAAIKVIELDVLSERAVSDNPPDRCYHCKKMIFGALTAAARADGYGLVLDGTNLSDDAGDRPGMRALSEFGVRSPLRECGLTKQAIRELSRQAGLFTWNKPAYSCLATRIPTGTPLTNENLARTEMAENYMFSLGFTDFRVRTRGGAALVQTRADERELLENNKDLITAELGKYYTEVLLDPEARK